MACLNTLYSFCLTFVVVTGSIALSVDKTAEIEKNTLISCPSKPDKEDIPVTGVRWIRKDTAGFIAQRYPNSAKSINDSKYKIDDADFLNLTIMDIMPSDEYVYKCICFFGAGKQEVGYVDLKVWANFSIAFPDLRNRTVSLQRSANFSVLCEASRCIPEADIKWYLNNKEIQNNEFRAIRNRTTRSESYYNISSELLLKRAEYWDVGNYTCSATYQGIGETRSTSFSLKISEVTETTQSTTLPSTTSVMSTTQDTATTIKPTTLTLTRSTGSKPNIISQKLSGARAKSITLAFGANKDAKGDTRGHSTAAAIVIVCALIVLAMLVGVCAFYKNRKKREGDEEPRYDPVSSPENTSDEANHDNQSSTSTTLEGNFGDFLIFQKDGHVSFSISSSSAERSEIDVMTDIEFDCGESEGDSLFFFHDNELSELDQWEFPRHYLFLHEHCIIGRGEFGEVKMADAKFSDNLCGNVQVAVKCLRENASSEDKENFLTELAIMKSFPERHPNVVSLLGCCTREEPIYIILEFVRYGSLQSNLRKSRSECTYQNLHPRSRDLTPSDLLKLAWQIAKGMAFLSSIKCIHRDLATRNILLGDDKICKISDFGLARNVHGVDIYEKKSQSPLPIRWMALESLIESVYTTKSDVWSYGIVLWEIVTLGSTPYGSMISKKVIEKLRGGYRIPRPGHCSEDIYKIMTDCWHACPKSRPSFSDLCGRIDDIIQNSTQEHLKMQDFEDHLYVNLDSCDFSTAERL
ncbi:tyrosine kinase receptor Cad96Ca-like isoform X1 [Ptychodera flava]|uniref:tyrosine kinase receptor Cad96Ca-like isoform X1 n=1 Tax=Ptychodera flava TaxID=63121 RepID=UPI00396A6DDA